MSVTQVLENLLKRRLNTEGLFGNLAVGLVSNVLQDISEEDPRIQVLIRPQQPERLQFSNTGFHSKGDSTSFTH